MRKTKETYETAALLLPPEYRKVFYEAHPEETEEIRLRIGKQMILVRAGENIVYDTPIIEKSVISYVLEKATDASIHTAISSIENGFISRQGIRIGICGEAVIKQGKFSGYRHYSSLNIRIPKTCTGICCNTAEEIFDDGLSSVLIISPPGMGKTSMLRDMICWLSKRGFRVGVIDERNEISGGCSGEMGFELGENTDVLLMTPKETGSMILLRGMNPQVIAMDEISTAEDARLLMEICGCGVHIIATAHASDLDDMKKRPCYAQIIAAHIFEYVVVIGIKDGKRIYSAVKIK